MMDIIAVFDMAVTGFIRMLEAVVVDWKVACTAVCNAISCCSFSGLKVHENSSGCSSRGIESRPKNGQIPRPEIDTPARIVTTRVVAKETGRRFSSMLATVIVTAMA